MRTIFLAGALLVWVLTLCAPMAFGQEQSSAPSRFQWSSTDLAMTYTTERAKTAPGTGDYFWVQGGSVDAGVTFYHGFGWAGNLTVEHGSRIAPGFSLRETDIMTGPRYTFRNGSKHQRRLFVETLAGVTHATDNVFPTSKGLTNKASAFEWQAGGGLDIDIGKHVAVRAFEVDYLRTYLPNNGANIQDHIRLAFGVTYHIPNH